MAEPGWYPDPGGRSGHYRFFDGQAWGLSTTTELPGAPPATPPPRGPRRSPGTRWVLAATVAAVVLVLVAVGALVVREQNRTIVDQGVSPSPGAPGVTPSDAPTPSTSPTSDPATPSTSPTPSPVPAPSEDPCPVGDPFSRQDHPQDGRAHGGGLSFPLPSGWTYPGAQTSSFTWAYDVGEADVRVEPSWFAAYAVGAVSTADGFEDPQTAAELMLRCTLASDLYRNVVDQPLTVRRQTTVDGHPAFTLAAEIRVSDDRTTFEGDRVVITVVDLDSPESLAFFWGCAPLGDATLSSQLEATARRLRVD